KLTLLTEKYNAHANNPKIFRIIVVNLADSSIVIDKGYANTFNLPKTGKHVVMLVFIDKTYWVSPQFLVQENGITYMQIPDSLAVTKDFDMLTNTQLYHSYSTNSSTALLPIDLSKVTGTTKKYYQSEKLIPTDNSLITHDSRKAIKITGKITDEKGEPLIAASIAEEGTTNGTYSDIDGLWELWVHDTQAVLECSYVGFRTETIKVGKETNFSVSLKQDAVQLQAIVRVGYAAAKYEDVTGGISMVRGEELVFSATMPVNQALQGKAAGVQIRSNSGTPGAGMDVVVRGMGTAGDASPLYVVDGVPVGTDWKGDPNTIESISILKDAPSVAMYGSRGASGVVLITTKGGNSVSASSFSWKDAAKHPDVYASNQIRETFRDYAYWQPTLRTDKYGMVKFTAKMPDDINTWNTFVVAHSAKRQSGDYQSQIITDKPLIAELSVPDFLIEGDTSIIRGNTKNYGGSAVSVTNTFIHNGKQLSISDTVVQTIITNEQTIVAP
ncbi:MAG TPA: TonB-dependent receptor plug domain-containing protein, partial [Bacteroidales bacterium]|nr:TonB-dependent receptor plug domain-containing protein [Bacteroidales bacterium]